jgi:hypothetical protein
MSRFPEQAGSVVKRGNGGIFGDGIIILIFSCTTSDFSNGHFIPTGRGTSHAETSHDRTVTD